MKIIFIVTALFFIVLINPAFAFDITEIQDRYRENQWWSGKNLSEGDYFIYEICNDSSFVKSTLAGHCYDISLYFVALLYTDTGKKWVVQAQIVTDEKKYSIFLIDDITFDITTDGTSLEYAESIQNTIFYMEKYSSESSKKHLKIGNSWGTVPSYMTPDPQITVREKSSFILQDIIPVYNIGYVILEHTQFQINNDMPFPVSAVFYDPHRIIPTTPKIFEFDLLYHNNFPDTLVDIFEEGILDEIKQDKLDFELESIVMSVEDKLGENP